MFAVLPLGSHGIEGHRRAAFPAAFFPYAPMAVFAPSCVQESKY
jgi:hypothetical protein